jgi:hypothetical protein
MGGVTQAWLVSRVGRHDHGPGESPMRATCPEYRDA